MDELTVLENIILGFEPRQRFSIDFAKARKDIQTYIDDYNMDIQLNKKINQISVGEPSAWRSSRRCTAVPKF